MNGTIYKRKIAETISRLREILLGRLLSTPWARLQLWAWRACVGGEFSLSGRIRLRIQGHLRIGNRVTIVSGYSNFVGASEPMAIWVCPGGQVHIGDRCGLSNTTIVCRDRINILEDTFIGGGCRIYDNDFHQLEPRQRLLSQGEVQTAPISIGPCAFIGGHCIILKGVTIGEGAVVGAGSVVTRDVPRFEIWAGIPARKIGIVAGG